MSAFKVGSLYSKMKTSASELGSLYSTIEMAFSKYEFLCF